MNEKITITCAPLHFYSENDEAVMAEWLKKIECIEKIENIGEALHLCVSSKKITDEDLRNLMALFRRYEFNQPNQLEAFKNKENEKWFEE